MGDDTVLRGDAGFWQHWWTMLHDPSTVATDRLVVELIVPTGDDLPRRTWHTRFHHAIRDRALSDARVTGRIIVPPEAIGSSIEAHIDAALAQGFDIRVLPSRSRFIIYNRAAALLTENAAPGTDGTLAPGGAGSQDAHRLARRPAMVTALIRLFELQWQAAIDWRERATVSTRVVEACATRVPR